MDELETFHFPDVWGGERTDRCHKVSARSRPMPSERQLLTGSCEVAAGGHPVISVQSTMGISDGEGGGGGRQQM